MITCTKSFTFDASHRLTKHEGACKNLHGHTYKAEVTCRGDDLDELGRVIDFSEIKRVVGEWIDGHWDHAFIAASDDYTMIDLCEDNGFKLFVMNGQPTAERMAQMLFQLHIPTARIVSVKLYETPTSWAEVRKMGV